MLIIEEMDLDELVIRLERADDAYYNTGHPLMEDWEYDQMKDQLRALDPNHPYLKKVGAKPTSGWKKVTHETPMGSLDKATSQDERERFWKHGYACVISEKLDGMSLSVKYEDGQMVQALTRGDGSVGEDITRNVLRMKGVKEKIGNFNGYLRGEVVVLKSDFQSHFASGYVNERNTANGVSKRHDGEGCEHLSVLFYRVMLDDPKQQTKLDMKSKEFKLLKKLGLPTPFWTETSTVDEAERVYQGYIESTRESIDYLIDGLVVDVDDKSVFDEMGDSNEGRPRGAVAYKFPYPKGKTRVNTVVWQTGKKGKITPVVMLEPIHVGGVTITHPTLHNPNKIKELGLEREGALVVVSRRGDVIPQIEEVVEQGTGTEIEIPKSCPSCGEPTVLDGKILRCENKGSCPAQVQGGIHNWIEAVGLLDWGVAVLERLSDEHGLSEPADIYRVTEDQLANLMLSGRVLGRSMAKRMIEARDKANSLSLGAALGALGIPMCAKNTCEDIVASGLDSLEKLRGATVADLCGIDGIGDSKARSFAANIDDATTKIERLIKAGFEIRDGSSGGSMVGMTVCFTGFRDADLHRAVEEAGGVMKNGVSKKLTHLVADNPDGNSGKLKKARSYGTKVIGVDELRRMLGQ